MHIVVLTPDQQFFDGDIKSVKVPGINGQFEVLDNHAPLVSALKEGPVRITDTSGTDTTFNIQKGFIEVLNNEISLLVQGLETS